MEWILHHVDTVAGSPVLQSLVVAASTMMFEDPTTITSGMLVAEGRMAFTTAMCGLIGGIVGSDVGLYVIGYVLGGKATERGWISGEQFDQAAGWLTRNLLMAVLASRFIPGSRLPMYLAAGVLRVPGWRFALYTLIASVAWVIPLLYLTVQVGEAIHALMGAWKWPLVIVAIAALVTSQLYFARKLKSAPPTEGGITDAGPPMAVSGPGEHCPAPTEAKVTAGP